MTCIPNVEVARLVFYLMGNKQAVDLCNPMIYALAQHDHGEEAIQMFDDMVGNGLRPDKITLVVILNACRSCGGWAEMGAKMVT